jgi:4-hydroxy-tetrahydrodipicolinate reductase
MIRAVVTGAGRLMGALIMRHIYSTDGIEIAGAMEREGHPLIGTDIGEVIGMDRTGHLITDLFTMTAREADVIIDFIPHETNLKYLRIAAERKIPIVIGTSGLNESELALISKASVRTRCILAPHMGYDDIFAWSAIRAAKWIVHQRNGLYDLQDIKSF